MHADTYTCIFLIRDFFLVIIEIFWFTSDYWWRIFLNLLLNRHTGNARNTRPVRYAAGEILVVIQVIHLLFEFSNLPNWIVGRI